MQITEGHLVAWAATAQALEQIDPDEVDLIPDIASSIHAPADRISRVPGAFDFDVTQLQSMAGVIFSIVTLCMGTVAPKLFDAALDIGKDGIKKVVEQRLKAKAAASTPQPAALDLARLSELVRVAVLERRLSPSTADIIANAVIAQLSIAPKP